MPNIVFWRLFHCSSQDFLFSSPYPKIKREVLKLQAPSMDSQREQVELRTVKHLIVISYDAFSEENWERASQYPNLKQLIKNGAYSTKLSSVYPTLTYVVHTTMVTGVYPDQHGIIHNNHFEPFVKEKDLSWYWFRREIKTPTIY